MSLVKQQMRQTKHKLTPAEEIKFAVSKRCSNLYAQLQYISSEQEGGLSVKCKSDGSWFGVIRSRNSDGDLVVAFGSGSDLFTCLVELNAAVQRGAWRPDKYAAEREERAS